MFEMLMLLGFFVIGFSHLLPPSGPRPERERPPAKTTPAAERHYPRGQRPAARGRAKATSPFRREERSVPGATSAPSALGKIRRLC